MLEHQVVIVGAGPAGAACAKALVEEAIDVFVVDRNELPRYKCCSGVLFGQTQVLLQKYFGGMPPSDIYATPRVIKAENIREWNEREGFKRYYWETDKDGESFPEDYCNIWRNKFDMWLLAQSGAPYWAQCSLRSFNSDGDGVTVTLERNADDGTSAPIDIRCSYLVGADGGSSKVRRILDPGWVSGGAAAEVSIHQGYFNIKDMGRLTDDDWSVFFEPEIGEMLACVSRKDDHLLLCVGGFRGRNLPASLQTLKAFLFDHFGVVLGDLVRTEGCVMRLAPPYLGTERVILTGEAAGHVYLNGEGISAAIDAGFRAGKAIATGLKKKVDALPIYEDTVADIHDHIKKCLEQIHFLSV